MAAAEDVRAPAAENEVRLERTALRVSTATAGVIAVLGIGWGIAAQSQVVLLDGVYATLSTLLSFATLYAARLVAAGPTPHYPFGREALGPLMVGVQGLVLLGTLAYAAVDALLVMRAGGSEASVGASLVYGVVTLAMSLGLTLWLRARRSASELVAAEVKQWGAGTLLSAAMVVGFAVAVALQRADSGLARFADPVLVLVAALLLVPAPVSMIRSTMRELLEAAPDPEVAGPVHEAVEAVRLDRGLPEPTSRLGKLGRKLYLELDFLVEPGRWDVGEADLVRHDLLQRLAEPGRLLWINVELHTDPGWDV
jgi:predicted Co/Zn/Cd cation transporter (cation efflux family)